MSAAQNKLLALTKELLANWEQTKDYWNDAKTQEFEKRYLQELTSALNQTVSNIDALERVIQKARADCE
jgi:hypothetical protein